jgi:hypothetical protein
MKSFFSLPESAKEVPEEKVSAIDYLKSRVAFAMNSSKSIVLIYEARGMVHMAWNLNAITIDEYLELIKMLKEYGTGE